MTRRALSPAGSILARVIVAVAAAAACLLLSLGRVSSQAPDTLILVSLDGWRWDYHTKTTVPNFRSLMERGVRAEGLIPSFPTKTFPNHYTIVTGLYPAHHGIVGNSIRDPATGRLFTMSARQEVRDAMWWGGDPIWNAVRRAGRKAAPYFWPGSEAPIGGQHADYWVTFDDSIPNEARVDRLLRWLDLPPAERPSFLTLYFSEVDRAGHRYGPEAPELLSAVSRVDAAVGRLLAGLERRNLIATTNIVLVSDHGMAETSRRRVIAIDDLIASSDGVVVDTDPTLGIWPAPGREQALFERLVKAHANLRVYRRDDTPEHWHYRGHPRIPPIVGVADEGWSVARRNRLLEMFSRDLIGIGGSHGYDPRARSMHGVFVAAGPAFRRGVVVPAFENVHVYLALAAALGVPPAPNDGDLAIARLLLR